MKAEAKPQPGVDRTIDVNGQPLTIRFGPYALFLIEQASGRSIETFEGVPNFTAFYLILFAGLECARQKYRSRPQPWTMDEVGELMESAGGMEALSGPVFDAWFAAFPKAKAALTKATPEAEEQQGQEVHHG